MVARQAHNLEVARSSRTPATKRLTTRRFFCTKKFHRNAMKRSCSFRKMITTNRKKCTRMALCMLSIFVFYQLCLTAFGHAHMVNGAVWVHSHPYGTQQHTHSDGQLHTIANLSYFIAAVPTLTISIAEPFITDTLDNTTWERTFFSATKYSANQFRAPPFFLSF